MATGADRLGSSSHHWRSRLDCQPLAPPSLSGELAKLAISVGPRAWASRQRSTMPGFAEAHVHL